MHSSLEKIASPIFFEFSGDSLANWKKVINQQVQHRKYGQGTITKVGYDKNKTLRIEIAFSADPEEKPFRQFRTRVFADQGSIRSLGLPDNLKLIMKNGGGWRIKRQLIHSPFLQRVPREARCWACQAELVEYSPDITPEGLQNCPACRWIECDCGACRSPQSSRGGCDQQITRLGTGKYGARILERFGTQTTVGENAPSSTDSEDEDWANSLASAIPPEV